MAKRARTLSLRIAMDLHRRHAVVLAELGGKWGDGLPSPVRRTLLRMLHQKQALIEADERERRR